MVKNVEVECSQKYIETFFIEFSELEIQKYTSGLC